MLLKGKAAPERDQLPRRRVLLLWKPIRFTWKARFDGEYRSPDV
jgi:hypothetical protein